MSYIEHRRHSVSKIELPLKLLNIDISDPENIAAVCTNPDTKIVTRFPMNKTLSCEVVENYEGFEKCIKTTSNSCSIRSIDNFSIIHEEAKIFNRNHTAVLFLSKRNPVISSESSILWLGIKSIGSKWTNSIFRVFGTNNMTSAVGYTLSSNEICMYSYSQDLTLSRVGYLEGSNLVSVPDFSYVNIKPSSLSLGGFLNIFYFNTDNKVDKNTFFAGFAIYDGILSKEQLRWIHKNKTL